MTNFGRLFVLPMTALLAGAVSSVPIKQETVVLWHTLDIVPAKFLQTLVDEFNIDHFPKVRLETGMELTPTLITSIEDSEQPPDMVLGPADLIGLAERLKFSEWKNVGFNVAIRPEVLRSVQHRGKQWGLPVIDGNHLMLYYNDDLVKQPARTWESLGKEVSSYTHKSKHGIAWFYNDPYVFFAFAAAFGVRPLDFKGHINLGPESLRQAFEFYRRMRDIGIVDPQCGYGCITGEFYKGQMPYVINGDWAYMDAKNALGDKLRIASLPSIAGQPMRSFCAAHLLFFPAQSLSGRYRKTLLAFAQFLTSSEVQRRWYGGANRIPVLSDAFSELAKQRDSNVTAMLKALNEAVRIPVAPAMLYVWPAVRKGLALFNAGTQSSTEASAFVQQLANEQYRAEVL